MQRQRQVWKPRRPGGNDIFVFAYRGAAYAHRVRRDAATLLFAAPWRAAQTYQLVHSVHLRTRCALSGVDGDPMAESDREFMRIMSVA